MRVARGHAIGQIGREMVLLHDGVERRQVDWPVQFLGQRGEYGGFVVYTGLLDGCAAEWAELAGDGQLSAAVLAKHGSVPPLYIIQ